MESKAPFLLPSSSPDSYRVKLEDELQSPVAAKATGELPTPCMFAGIPANIRIVTNSVAIKLLILFFIMPSLYF